MNDQPPFPPDPLPPAASTGESAARSSVTAPGFVVQILVQTRGWAIFSALGLFVGGIITVLVVRQQWRASLLAGGAGVEDTSLLDKGLNYLDAGFNAVLAAACFYVGVRLFRYAAAISRLRVSGGMRQLESALRHQRAVWIVFGALAAFWLVLFAWQLWDFLTTLWEAGLTGIDPIAE